MPKETPTTAPPQASYAVDSHPSWESLQDAIKPATSPGRLPTLDDIWLRPIDGEVGPTHQQELQRELGASAVFPIGQCTVTWFHRPSPDQTGQSVIAENKRWFVVFEPSDDPSEPPRARITPN